MRRGRVAAIAFACAVFSSMQAEAGNGSNYIHLMNGVEYQANLGGLGGGGLPGQATNITNGIWRCFDADLTHAPTIVMNNTEPLFGTYSLKLCSIYISASGTIPIFDFPNVTVSSNFGDCRFLQTVVTNQPTPAPNFWGIQFGGIPGNQNGAVIGPLNDPTASGTGLGALINDVNVAFLIGLVGAVNAAPGALQLLELDVASPFGLSAVPISENENVVLWVHDSNSQSAGAKQYFGFSGDERMVCSVQSSSGFSLVASTGFFSSTQLPSAPAGTDGGWEWGIGLGVLDATTQAIALGLTSTAAKAGGIDNANGATTWPTGIPGVGGPFDAGQAARKLSLSATSLHVSSGTFTETLGFATYDEFNDFILNSGHPANGRVVLAEVNAGDIASILGGGVPAPDCHDRNAILSDQFPGSILNGLGSGQLLILGGFIQSRIVGDFDPQLAPAPYNAPPNGGATGPYPSGSAFSPLAQSLLASFGWLLVTSHETAVGGIDIPFLPTPTAGISGATQRTNPGVGVDITAGGNAGVTLLVYSWGLNGAMPPPYTSNPMLPAGSAIAANANNGHSLSMGSTFTFWP